MEVPLHRSRYGRSREAFSRYSENSLHSNYLKPEDQKCVTRIPYATLIATIMCCVGVGIFCGTMYRGVTLTAIMFSGVFRAPQPWLETLQTMFVFIACIMGALGLMILFVGFLTTGATRQKVYRAWRARIGGRISCMVYMVITYILQMFWMFMFCCLVIVTFALTLCWNICASERTNKHECIDFQQFDFLFPKETRIEYMKICQPNDIKLFCKDYVEKAEYMFILATSATVLIILSLIHYLMCLSANYAHIRDHEKLQELQELQYLQDAELTSSKDRF
ncbi:hypothetical protein V9T40_008693 [Parthenolecanium corni]|uniref:Neuronal membrane glycoprotein M6-b n=1 Tax=Parthenolecanium corni TaxID=536013 RepID=A0AAN9TM91_9HEMI